MAEIAPAKNLLSQATRGNRDAIERLFSLCYDELRVIAARRLSRERRNHSLQPTALVNEAFLRLVGDADVDVDDRTQFCTIAAEAMRRILIEHARRRGAAKRGGGWKRVTLDSSVRPSDEADIDLLALDLALNKLSEEDPRLVRIVELRFFGGLTVAEVAGVLRVSKRTAESEWTFVRAWLAREIGARNPSGRRR